MLIIGGLLCNTSIIVGECMCVCAYFYKLRNTCDMYCTMENRAKAPTYILYARTHNSSICTLSKDTPDLSERAILACFVLFMVVTSCKSHEICKVTTFFIDQTVKFLLPLPFVPWKPN